MNVESLLKLLEYGATLSILIIILYIMYRIGLKFIDSYMENLKEKHRLEREDSQRKDIEFLKAVKDVSGIVQEGDVKHDKAHTMLGDKIDTNHKNISCKLDGIHDIITKK